MRNVADKMWTDKMCTENQHTRLCTKLILKSYCLLDNVEKYGRARQKMWQGQAKNMAGPGKK
jgi:hypothetical protein